MPSTAKVSKNKYAPTTWGSGGHNTFDIEVPSGQLCKVRRGNVQTLLQNGVLNDVDSLTAIVNNKYVNKATKEVDVQQLMSDPQALTGVLKTVDSVICQVVIAPEVYPVPPDGLRVDGFIYVDTVDVEDKMFIFQYVLGGTSNLEQFRAESNELMDSLVAGEPVES